MTGLQSTDVVVRFDRSTKTLSLLTVDVRREKPITHVIHEVSWNCDGGLSGVIDVGAAVCSYLFAAHPEVFCSVEQWEKLAEAIRVATGRDAEE